MYTLPKRDPATSWPVLSGMPVPAKALITAVLLTLALAMTGALGQIIVHDIIPTFFTAHTGPSPEPTDPQPTPSTTGTRGDLFGKETVSAPPPPEPIYKDEQFVWTLKWTHIHLFGMNMIFFFLGAVTLFLDMGVRAKTWLIILPFVGVIVDIVSMWLKGFVSPVFFWLHIPGGGLFVSIFCFVFFRAMAEMWWTASRK